MSDTVISVEGLSKCYLLGHQAARGEHYETLRETVTRGGSGNLVPRDHEDLIVDQTWTSA
jgi:hypothetical protein